ncbi:phosphonate ABC transporter, permease protein PhnE [Paenibacillus artemisiicola]|uniref:phosphonate ABC transporter, permease protein PhnE n=1 Tax=Paenibacillus artemisiicola TaxID=1172618 RepID=UPI0030B8AB81
MEKRLLELRRQKRLQTLLGVALALALVIVSSVRTRFTPYTVFQGVGEMFKFVVNDFLPPDLSTLNELLGPALDTIYMSYIGMVIGAAVSVVLAFLAAQTTAPHRGVQVATRAFASVMRNIPTIIWAIVLVAAYGLGTLVGTLALIITAIGTLTRAYAEILEEIDMGQVEAVRATGASYFQVLGQAVVPQFFPGFVAWSLYKLELNVRSSTIIGMVGGGGLGFVIQKGLKLFQFKEVSLAVILVLLLVAGTEFVTSKIRERIL